MKLLYPKFAQLRNRVAFRSGRSLAKSMLVAAAGLVFWAAIFIVCYRILSYFRGIEIVGSFLAGKLLSMIVLTFFSVLVFSNIITALSVFFMSEELQLVCATPFDIDELYLSKAGETLLNSSWMVALFSLPVFISYGIVFRQGPGYYLALPACLLPLFMIAAAAGIAIALGLVKSFPARRLKDVFFLLALFLFIILYSMFRFMKPERLLDPDVFFSVIDYLGSLRAPTSPFLPSQWAADILAAFLFQQPSGETLFSLGCLWSTALALLVLLGWWFTRAFPSAWSRAQEAKTVRITQRPLFTALLNRALSGFSPPLRAIVDKDIRSFLRDTAQWSQLFILCAIVAIYLYNFSVLPLEKSPIPTRQLQNIISFLNTGLAGFVLTAVAVRLAYPAVSLEGESFWLVKSSPLGLRRLLWCKFAVNFTLLTALAQVLSVASNLLLNADPVMTAVSSATVFLLGLGISGLGVGIGAAYPRFRYENIAQIPTGFGGLLFMILSVLLCIAVVAIEALPLEMYFRAADAGRMMLPEQVAVSVSCALLIAVLCGAAFFVGMRQGLRKLSRIESF